MIFDSRAWIMKLVDGYTWVSNHFGKPDEHPNLFDLAVITLCWMIVFCLLIWATDRKRPSRDRDSIGN